MIVIVTKKHIEKANEAILSMGVGRSFSCPLAQALIPKAKGQLVIAGQTACGIGDVAYRNSSKLRIQVQNFDKNKGFRPGRYAIYKIK